MQLPIDQNRLGSYNRPAKSIELPTLTLFCPTRIIACLLTINLMGCSQLATQNDAAAIDSEQPDFDAICSVDNTTLTDYPEPEFPDLWDRMRSGFSLQHIDHPRVEKHINWYKRHQSYFNRVGERGSRYMYHIVIELEKRDMPLELALLPIVESAFDPFAYSHGRAAGMWQFVPRTGKAFGLDQNWWYDGRRDVVASTDAALTYLDKLSTRFGDDYMLGLAAYNAGGGNVNKAIRRNKKAGKATDYWSLKLPRETQNYVPQLIALSNIVLEPERYGITLPHIDNAPRFEVVDIGGQLDLAQAAQMADMDLDQLYLFNPGFNRWATAPNGPHHLVIPIEKADVFEEELAKLPPNERIHWRRYTIQSGDSLITIARKHHIEVDLLKDINNLSSNRIRAGKTLLIPQAQMAQSEYKASLNQRLKKRQNTAPNSKRSHKTYYTVKSGDSFWKIATDNGVSSKSLAKWNGMAPGDPLKIGQKLVIWQSAPRTTTNASGVTRKVTYKVRNGDSLARIADKFNLRVTDIKRWNPNDTKGYIHPGDRLTLFVDVTRIN